MDTAIEAELRCRSLPHRDEMPKRRGRPSENAEDTALSLWPFGGTRVLEYETYISRLDRESAGRYIDQSRMVSTKSGCVADEKDSGLREKYEVML